jgi:hypothetical protein
MKKDAHLVSSHSAISAYDVDFLGKSYRILEEKMLSKEKVGDRGKGYIQPSEISSQINIIWLCLCTG